MPNMHITPSIKGQLTKAKKTNNASKAIRAIFERMMPKEQAKHATRNYLIAR